MNNDPLIIDLDVFGEFQGVGDALMMAWVASAAPDKVRIRSHGHQRRCLNFLDIQLDESNLPSKPPAYLYLSEQADRGAISRMDRIRKFCGVTESPVRPQLRLNDDLIGVGKGFWYGINRPRVLLCPEVNDATRAWPSNRWCSLRKHTPGSRFLTRKVCESLSVSQHDSWGTAFAIIEQCDLIIGVDSAFMHCAAICDKPILVITGPTGPTAFEYHPRATCITAPQPAACNGCYFREKHGFDDNLCRRSCGEIAKVSTEQVLAASFHLIESIQRANHENSLD